MQCRAGRGRARQALACSCVRQGRRRRPCKAQAWVDRDKPRQAFTHATQRPAFFCFFSSRRSCREFVDPRTVAGTAASWRRRPWRRRHPARHSRSLADSKPHAGGPTLGRDRRCGQEKRSRVARVIVGSAAEPPRAGGGAGQVAAVEIQGPERVAAHEWLRWKFRDQSASA